jgi:hypothetical protein
VAVGLNWAHPARPDETGRFEDRKKIDDPGGGLIKSAFARFLEQQSKIEFENFEISAFWTILR